MVNARRYWMVSSHRPAHDDISSLRAQYEFLNHRVREQFTGKLSDPGQSAVIGLTAQFHLKPLALPHTHHIAVSKSLAGA